MVKKNNPIRLAYENLAESLPTLARWVLIRQSRRLLQDLRLQLVRVDGDPYVYTREMDRVRNCLMSEIWQRNLERLEAALEECKSHLDALVKQARSTDKSAIASLREFVRQKKLPFPGADSASIEVSIKSTDLNPELSWIAYHLVEGANTGIPVSPSDDAITAIINRGLAGWQEGYAALEEEMLCAIKSIRLLATCRDRTKDNIPAWHVVAAFLCIWKADSPWKLSQCAAAEAQDAYFAYIGKDPPEEKILLIEGWSFSQSRRKFFIEAGLHSDFQESREAWSTGSRDFDEQLLLKGASREHRPGSGQTRDPRSHERGHR